MREKTNIIPKIYCILCSKICENEQSFNENSQNLDEVQNMFVVWLYKKIFDQGINIKKSHVLQSDFYTYNLFSNLLGNQNFDKKNQSPNQITDEEKYIQIKLKLANNSKDLRRIKQY
ncbi:hypothetical protein ABPG73_008238 [Tetrahymena malaccensis]